MDAVKPYSRLDNDGFEKILLPLPPHFVISGTGTLTYERDSFTYFVSPNGCFLSLPKEKMFIKKEGPFDDQ